jgi:hypothetical protein
MASLLAEDIQSSTQSPVESRVAGFAARLTLFLTVERRQRQCASFSSRALRCKAHLAQVWPGLRINPATRSTGECFRDKPLPAPNPAADKMTTKDRSIDICARLSGVALSS